VLIGFFGVQAIKKVQLGIEHVILAGSIIFIVFILWLGRRYLTKETKNTGDSTKETNDKEG